MRGILLGWRLIHDAVVLIVLPVVELLRLAATLV